MKGYLLSIELREVNDLSRNEVGDIVLLDQAWCNDLDDVAHEFSDPMLTGSRFELAIRKAREGRTEVSHKAIAADPRGTTS